MNDIENGFQFLIFRTEKSEKLILYPLPFPILDAIYERPPKH